MRLLPGWSGRTEVQRVWLYTVGSLYLIYWFLVPILAFSAARTVSDAVAMGVVTIVVGVAGSFTLRRAVALYPDHAPVPWKELTSLVALVVVADGLVFLLPEKVRFSAALVLAVTLAWGAGGLRDRGSSGACTPLASPWCSSRRVTSRSRRTVSASRCSSCSPCRARCGCWAWSPSSTGRRRTQAALAVAEERLRFSRDVHDVMGRRLSTIAVQAELAATLATRGDERAPEQILQVRETAHEALREARELARGYRPLDLAAEVDGAVSLLRSAGSRRRAPTSPTCPRPGTSPVAG